MWRHRCCTGALKCRLHGSRFWVGRWRCRLLHQGLRQVRYTGILLLVTQRFSPCKGACSCMWPQGLTCLYFDLGHIHLRSRLRHQERRLGLPRCSCYNYFLLWPIDCCCFCKLSSHIANSPRRSRACPWHCYAGWRICIAPLLDSLLSQADCIAWSQHSILQLRSAKLAASGCLTCCAVRHRLHGSLLLLQGKLSQG